MPDVRAFMASGYFNGKIYLVGGYNTGNVDPSFGQVWEYDPVANTFNTSRMNMPATLGGPGFGIINGHMYVAGGRDLNNTNLNTLYDYNIATDSWTTGATMPTGVNVPASAVIGGKLWVFGGGNPFTGPSTAPTSGGKGVRAWLKRVFNPDTTNALQVYDPASNTWSSGPGLIQQRAFPAGTHVGNTAVAVGGYTGSNTTTSVEINVTGGGCPSPTPTGTPQHQHQQRQQQLRTRRHLHRRRQQQLRIRRQRQRRQQPRSRQRRQRQQRPRHCHSNSYRHRDSNGDGIAAGYTDAKASADTAGACGRQLLFQ